MTRTQTLGIMAAILYASEYGPNDEDGCVTSAALFLDKAEAYEAERERRWLESKEPSK